MTLQKVLVAADLAGLTLRGLVKVKEGIWFGSRASGLDNSGNEFY